MKYVPLALTIIAGLMVAAAAAPGISGQYLEFRSCDVYTGPCFANGEMDLSGKEAILVWSVDRGAWNGVTLDGLNVIAVVRTEATLGDLRYQPCSGKALLLVDERASAEQQDALAAMAQEFAGGLIAEVAAVKPSPIEAKLGTCDGAGCASVIAGDIVTITTRCLGNGDHLCGNESTYYPPLTAVEDAYPAYTTLASFHDPALEREWDAVGQRGTFLARFSR